MGRPRLWRIKALTRAEIEVRNRFIEGLEKLASASTIRERLRQDWDLFLRLNQLNPTCKALELFVADFSMVLAPSSAHEYCSKLSSLPAMKLPGFRTVWSHLCRLLNIRAADADTKHALDIDHATASKIISNVEDEADRMALSIMALLGPRAQDVRHLRVRQLDIPVLNLRRKYAKEHYRANVRIAKNRKCLGRRVNLYVPVEMRSPLRRTANTLGTFLRECHEDHKVFAKCTANRLNRSLRKACEKLEIGHYTTYSFRRMYICEAIRFHKRNFTKVRELTLHFAEETIRSYYDKW